MSDDGILGSTLGQLGDIAKQAGKTLLNEPGNLAKTTAKQVGIATPEAAEKEKSKEAAEKLQSQQVQEVRQKQNEDIVKAMYAPSEQNQSQHKNTQVEHLAQQVAENNPDKTPEEIQKMTSLQQQLHRETYYDPTFNRPKQEEPRAAEKVEQEKQQEMIDLQKKEEEKPKPIIDKAQNIEKFRGASG